MENTKTYRTDEEVSALADMCVSTTTRTINLLSRDSIIPSNNDEAKAQRLSALYQKYGICLDEIIEKAVERAEQFVKCPVCEQDDDCLCCHGEGRITRVKYNKLVNVVGKFR